MLKKTILFISFVLLVSCKVISQSTAISHDKIEQMKNVVTYVINDYNKNPNLHNIFITNIDTKETFQITNNDYSNLSPQLSLQKGIIYYLSTNGSGAMGWLRQDSNTPLRLFGYNLLTNEAEIIFYFNRQLNDGEGRNREISCIYLSNQGSLYFNDLYGNIIYKMDTDKISASKYFINPTENLIDDFCINEKGDEIYFGNINEFYKSRISVPEAKLIGKSECLPFFKPGNWSPDGKRFIYVDSIAHIYQMDTKHVENISIPKALKLVISEAYFMSDNKLLVLCETIHDSSSEPYIPECDLYVYGLKEKRILERVTFDKRSKEHLEFRKWE